MLSRQRLTGRVARARVCRGGDSFIAPRSSASRSQGVPLAGVVELFGFCREGPIQNQGVILPAADNCGAGTGLLVGIGAKAIHDRWVRQQVEALSFFFSSARFSSALLMPDMARTAKAAIRPRSMRCAARPLPGFLL